MQCILKCGEPCHEVDSIASITDDKWTNIQFKAEKWLGLDRFGDVFTTTLWCEKQKGCFMHNTCYLSLSSSKKLEAAQRRFQKAKEKETASSYDDQGTGPSTQILSPSPKRTRFSTGVIHDKNHCVWCMKSDDNRHPNRSKDKLYRIEKLSRWKEFKRHVPFLENVEMRRRISCLIDSTPDPFAADILYHNLCWLKYALMRNNEENYHTQNINIDDARNLFFGHVDKVLFQEREIRSLQSLLSDYKLIVGDYGYDVGNIKSSYLKEILVKEYGQSIGFKERPQKNHSDWVYDVAGGGTYIDAAINSTGVSDEQLMKNLCGRLHVKIKETKSVSWPPRIDQLEEEENICTSLIQLLSWLKHPNTDSLDYRPNTLCIASIVTQYVTGQRSTTCINLGVDLHGHTRSKEIIDIFHKAGLIVSYADIQLLYDKWVLEDLNECMNIPREIANGVPVICIADNDDFKIDTLTGRSRQAHRTNVMFVQPQRIEHKSDVNVENSSGTNKAEISTALKHKAAELTSVAPYRAPRTVSSEPLI